MLQKKPEAFCTKCPFYADVFKITKNLSQFDGVSLDFVGAI
jgi:hypothetical protein